jgi:hypothetical protein
MFILSINITRFGTTKKLSHFLDIISNIVYYNNLYKINFVIQIYTS